MVSSAMKPWFEAFVGARGANKDGDGKLGMWHDAFDKYQNLTNTPIQAFP